MIIFLCILALFSFAVLCEFLKEILLLDKLSVLFFFWIIYLLLHRWKLIKFLKFHINFNSSLRGGEFLKETGRILFQVIWNLNLNCVENIKKNLNLPRIQRHTLNILRKKKSTPHPIHAERQKQFMKIKIPQRSPKQNNTRKLNLEYFTQTLQHKKVIKLAPRVFYRQFIEAHIFFQYNHLPHRNNINGNNVTCRPPPHTKAQFEIGS